uniref:ER lumen protein retaining receptor n=1 Tax=Rhizophora mucronata TaxID=61149 RepID=A0A2P2IS64_RHIMU
MGAATAAEG